jgi:alcohol dehydrogenase class IV
LEYADSFDIPKGTTEILSVGGGSTLDVGKWLAFKYKLRHTAIPTTAGTGSEVTRYCVLTVQGKKTTYELRKPDSYILDPRLVTTLPELHTLSSGLDALCQALEA